MQPHLTGRRKTRQQAMLVSLVSSALFTTASTADTTNLQWVRIAGENEAFTVAGPTLIRYGMDSNWVYRVVAGAAICSNEFFQNDPLVGTVKECDVPSGSAKPEPEPAQPIPPPPASASATLSWTPSSDTSAVGYILYYGTVSGQYDAAQQLGDVTTLAVSGLQRGVLYYFAVTALDAAGNESAASNEVAKIAE